MGTTPHRRPQKEGGSDRPPNLGVSKSRWQKSL